MTAIDILLIIITGLSAIILLAILIKSLCLIIADTTNERRTKKMKKKKEKTKWRARTNQGQVRIPRIKTKWSKDWEKRYR